MERISKDILKVIVYYVNPRALSQVNKRFRNLIKQIVPGYAALCEHRNLYSAADVLFENEKITNYDIYTFTRYYALEIIDYIFNKLFRLNHSDFVELYSKLIEYLMVDVHELSFSRSTLEVDDPFIYKLENLKYFIEDYNFHDITLYIPLSTFRVNCIETIKVLCCVYDKNSCITVALDDFTEEIEDHDDDDDPYVFPMKLLPVRDAIPNRPMESKHAFAVITQASTIEIFEYMCEYESNTENIHNVDIYANYVIIYAEDISLINHLLENKIYTQSTLYIALCTSILSDDKLKVKTILDFHQCNEKNIYNLPDIVIAILLFAKKYNNRPFIDLIYNYVTNISKN